MAEGTFLARLTGLLRRDAPKEGEPRPGPWPVINPDGWLPNAFGRFMNFWQMGFDPLPFARSAVVEACVAAYAETIAMCPGDHWRALPNGGRERVTTSALSRLLRLPNDYQSRSDFILNLVRQLYLEGNSYHLALRNDRYEVASLHPFDPRDSGPLVDYEGNIFYKLRGNNIIQPQEQIFGRQGELDYGVFPARDVLHLKLEAENAEPLKGIPPLRHAATAVAVQGAIGSQLINFFANMSRPSGIITTDKTLSKTQTDELRKAWDEQARGLNAGGIPILTAGLKFQGIAISGKDAELVNAMKMSQDEIFMIFGVPPAILGMTDRSTFASTEALMQFWLSRGLGFAINHVEVGFDQFFGLKGYPDEYVEFDTQALLRVAYKDRIEALARGVQGAVFSPNEARRSESLPDAPYGNEPRVQQQVVPLSAWAKTPPQTPAPPASPPAGGTGDEEPDEEPPAEADDEEAAASFDALAVKLRRLVAKEKRNAKKAA